MHIPNRTLPAPVSVSRRRVLRGGLALGALPLLAACGLEPPVFNSVDITGATYGPALQQLQDPAGRSRSVADFRGQVVAVFFGFTQCPDVCPTALSRLKEVKTLLGADGGRFVAIFVSVDPERDMPEVLQAYVTAFDPSFVALRGDAAATRAVADEFRVFYEKVPTGPDSYTMDHTTGAYLFDPKGRVRLFSRHHDVPAMMLEDVRTLLKEDAV